MRRKKTYPERRFLVLNKQTFRILITIHTGQEKKYITDESVKRVMVIKNRFKAYMC